MNKDLETIIERSDASFEKTVREQTPVDRDHRVLRQGLMIAFYGNALHFK